jgi:hypothetical protein
MGIRQRTLALLVGLVLARPDASTPAQVVVQDSTRTLTVQKVQSAAPFQRDGRLILTDRELVFETGKRDRLAIPYERIRTVQVFAGTTGGQPIVDPSGVGLFWGFVKHKKAGFVFDYANERGGAMGLVLMADPREGSAIRDWLSRFGVPLRDFAPKPPATTSP